MMGWTLLTISALLLIGFILALKSTFDKKKENYNLSIGLLAGTGIVVVLTGFLIPLLTESVTKDYAQSFSIMAGAGLGIWLFLYATAKDPSEKAKSYEVTKNTIRRLYGFDENGVKNFVYGVLGTAVMLVVTLVMAVFLAKEGTSSILSIVPLLDSSGMVARSAELLDIFYTFLGATAEDLIRANIIMIFEILMAYQVLQSPIARKKYKTLEEAMGKGERSREGFFVKFNTLDIPFGMASIVISILIGVWFGTWHEAVAFGPKGGGYATMAMTGTNGGILYFIQRNWGTPATIFAHFLFNIIVKMFFTKTATALVLILLSSF